MRTWLAALLVLCLAVPYGVVARSLSTQEIHRSTTCTADGYCQPEVYVVRQDPAQTASIQVDYVPSTDALLWDIRVRNIRNLTVDAQVNYDTRGCLEFFADCGADPTPHRWWLSQWERLTVRLDSDVQIDMRVLEVPHPEWIEVDAALWNDWSREPAGGTIYNVPAGVRLVVFFFTKPPSPPGQGTDPSLFSLRCDPALLEIRCSLRMDPMRAVGVRFQQVDWYVDGTYLGNGTPVHNHRQDAVFPGLRVLRLVNVTVVAHLDNGQSFQRGEAVWVDNAWVLFAAAAGMALVAVVLLNLRRHPRRRGSRADA